MKSEFVYSQYDKSNDMKKSIRERVEMLKLVITITTYESLAQTDSDDDNDKMQIAGYKSPYNTQVIL